MTRPIEDLVFDEKWRFGRCRDLAGSRIPPLVEQLIDLPALRLTTVLADRPANRGKHPQFGVNDVGVTYAAKRRATSNGW